MLGYASKREQFAAYNDGVVTRHDTFQKYFTQDEFKTYVEESLGAGAVPIAPGICLVFRDPMEEQLFLPARLQCDVRFFFGNITKARAAGKRTLYAIADPERIRDAAVFCHDELGIGQLNDLHDLIFHRSVLGECLPLIRIVVGCALTLFGDVATVDLIKVHLESSKVTFLNYDDFENGVPPKLVERIKVDLPRLRVDFFDYAGQFEPQPLVGSPIDYYQR